MSAAADHDLSKRAAGWAILVILVGGVALRAVDLDAPFGNGYRGVNGAMYYGQFEKHYLELGLAGTRGGLVLQSWPGTTEGMFRDLSHPTLPSYLFHAAVLACGGRIELGLRLLPFLAASLGILALWWTSRLFLSRTAALGVALLAATSPMWAYFGVMIVAECFLLLWGAAVLRAVLLHLDGQAPLSRVVLLFFIGCLLDWNFFFFAPAAWVIALLYGGAERRRWRLLWLFPAGCLAFAIFFLHGAWAAGGWEPLLDRLTETATTASAAQERLEWSSWAAAQARFMLAWYTWPAIALLGIWCLTAVARLWCRPPVARLDPAVLFFLVAGGISTILFRRHSLDHEFWTMGMAGGIYVAGGGLLDRFRRPALRPLRIGILAAILGAAVLGVLATRAAQSAERTTLYRDRAATVNALAGPDDVVITSEPWYQEAFYVRAHAFPHIRERARIEHDLLGRFRDVLLPRIFLLFPPADLENDPGVQDIVAWAAPFCLPPRRVGRFVVYEFEPGG